MKDLEGVKPISRIAKYEFKNGAVLVAPYKVFDV
jgi:hypothetical protein